MFLWLRCYINNRLVLLPPKEHITYQVLNQTSHQPVMLSASSCSIGYNRQHLQGNTHMEISFSLRLLSKGTATTKPKEHSYRKPSSVAWDLHGNWGNSGTQLGPACWASNQDPPWGDAHGSSSAIAPINRPRHRHVANPVLDCSRISYGCLYFFSAISHLASVQHYGG